MVDHKLRTNPVIIKYCPHKGGGVDHKLRNNEVKSNIATHKLIIQFNLNIFYYLCFSISWLKLVSPLNEEGDQLYPMLSSSVVKRAMSSFIIQHQKFGFMFQ